MLVAFAGFIGTGKDTAAKHLIEERGYKRLSFASLLKDVVALLFGLDREMLEGATEEARAARNQRLPYWDSVLDLDQEVTPRYLLQFVAEDCFRKALHRDFWVLAVEVQVMKMLDRNDNVVLTDLRHINEWLMVRKHGGHCFGIYRTLPWWVKDFYKHMEYLLPGGVADIDFDHPFAVADAVAHAYKFFQRPLKGMDKVIHVSEWQHLLIPFDSVIQNTKSKQALWNQVEDILYPQT